jgi:hypothetical protein
MDTAEPNEGTGSASAPASLGRRLADLLLRPSSLAQELAEHPVWGGAFLLAVALGTLQLILIPEELWDTVMQEAAIQQGREMPDWLPAFMRWFRIFGAPVGMTIYIFVKSAVVTVLFTFVLGDEGKFKRYLSVVTHSQLIPVAVGMLLTPLRIAAGDAQLRLTMASFFPFLDGGYPFRVLNTLDLTQLWAWVIVAFGASAIGKRTLESSLWTVFVWAMLLALVFGFFPQPGL